MTRSSALWISGSGGPQPLPIDGRPGRQRLRGRQVPAPVPGPDRRHGARPSMFWFDSEGALTELTPEVVAGETADSLRHPPSGAKDVVRLQGPPGTTASAYQSP